MQRGRGNMQQNILNGAIFAARSLNLSATQLPQ
jgi:hypothetical protein